MPTFMGSYTNLSSKPNKTFNISFQNRKVTISRQQGKHTMLKREGLIIDSLQYLLYDDLHMLKKETKYNIRYNTDSLEY